MRPPSAPPGAPPGSGITRRHLLSSAVLLASAATVAACSDESEGPPRPKADGTSGSGTSGSGAPDRDVAALRGLDRPPAIPPYEPVAAYPEGVLSGSPLTDAVVLWTRVRPTEVGAEPDSDVEVTVELSTDVEFGTVLTSETRTAEAASDHCVAFDTTGLTAGSWYYYRFTAGRGPDRVVSPVGRTRTLPGRDAGVATANIAFFSCQRYTHGWYTSHRHLAAQQELDLVISLGDYVYEDSSADGIVVDGRLDPTEPADDLTTFRRKYELYRSDPDLQAMHAAAPFVCVPDNHDGLAGPWDDPEAVSGALDAFFERMPFRRDAIDPARIHGELRWGDLFHLWMLDIRSHRDEPPTGDILNTAGDPDVWDTDRTLLGADQKAWFRDGIAESTATWKLVGTGQMFSPTRIADLDDVATRAGDPGRVPNAGLYINGAQWDGYQAERRELVQHLHDSGVRNTIVLSGDMHWFAAGDGQIDVDDPDSPYVYSEFTGGSVTSAAGERFSSDGGPVTPGILDTVRAANSQMIRFFDVDRHGHGAVSLTPERANVDFVSPTTVATPDAAVEVLASFEIAAGGNGMTVTKGAQW